MATVPLSTFLGRPAPPLASAPSAPRVVPLRTFLGGDGAAAQPLTRAPWVRATPPMIPGVNPVLTDLSQAQAALGQAGVAGRVTNVVRPGTIPSQALGGLQAGGGALQLALALAREGHPVSRAFGGASGAVNLAGGALRVAPEAATALLPATGAFSPAALQSGFGLAGGVLGLGTGAYQLAQGNTAAGIGGVVGGGAALAGSAASAGLLGSGTAAALGTVAPALAFPLIAKAAIDLLTFLTTDQSPVSAQSRWEAEAASNREGFAGDISTATTPADIAAVFNRRVGRRYSGQDITPEAMRQELAGNLFDLSASGGSGASLARSMLARALTRAFPGEPSTPYTPLFHPDLLRNAVARIAPYTEGIHPDTLELLYPGTRERQQNEDANRWAGMTF